MNARRVILLLVIMCLMLSLTPSNVVAYALPSPILSRAYGSMGRAIKVTGSTGAIPSGGKVELYWDEITGVWDGVKGLQNSTTADSRGAYEVWFRVPEAPNGDHSIWVKDEDGNTASALFSVETKNDRPNTGLPGDTIETRFYGFHPSRDLAVMLSTVDPPASTTVDNEILGSPNGVATQFNGTLAHKYIAPGSIHFRASGQQYARDDGGGNIVGYTDNPDVTGTINYVTGAYNIIFPTAPQAMQNGLGTDYDYWGTSSEVTPTTIWNLGTGTSNIVGSAVITWKVPQNVTYLEPYKLISFDATGLRNTNSFKIMGIHLNPSSGPTGAVISITGDGLTPDTTWSAEIGSKTLVEDGITSSSGQFLGGTGIQIPSNLLPGDYMIAVWDSEDFFEPSAKFTVTYNTSITLTPPDAPNNYNITIFGRGFSYLATGLGDLAFTLYNTTSTGGIAQTWDMDVRHSEPGDGTRAAAINSTGMFEAHWVVPGLSSLNIGKYYINAIDADGYSSHTGFNVLVPHVAVKPRNETFNVGESIYFEFEDSSNTAPVIGSVMKVSDPSSRLFFTIDALNANKWVKTGQWYTIPYSAQTANGIPMTIPSNATPGQWSYKWVGADNKDIASGKFTVKSTTVLHGTLRIKVKDPNGNILTGVTVSSSQQPSGQTMLSGVTGADGIVIFTDLALGNYTIQVSKGGYVSGSTQGAVYPNDEVELSVTLQAQPSGGIPGFPAESQLTGLLLSLFGLWFYKRMRSPSMIEKSAATNFFVEKCEAPSR